MSSQPNESVVQNVINQVHEMFPQHSYNQVSRVVRQNNANIDAAISAILEIPPEGTWNPPQQSHRQQQNSYSQPSPQPHRPKKSAQHIFPPDFLRWPENAQVMKEYLPGTPGYTEGMYNPNNYMFQMGFEPCDPNDDPIPDTPSTGKKTQSRWESFKSMFKGKSRTDDNGWQRV